MDDQVATSRRTTHVLRIGLRGEPSACREIEVLSADSLHELADMIVSAFGFDFDHAFGFYQLAGAEGPRYEVFADMGEWPDTPGVKNTRVADALPGAGAGLLLVFDYQRRWRFTVEVIAFGRRCPRLRYPRTLKSVGAAPEQYPTGHDAPRRSLGPQGDRLH